MGLMKFDRLNVLSENEPIRDNRGKISRKKIPIHEYFEDMQISEEQKQKRIRLANLLLADVLFLFALSKGNDDKQYLVKSFQNRYTESVKSVAQQDKELSRYIRKVCENIVDTTLKDTKKSSDLTDSAGNEYRTSIDRAMNIAENEANSILNNDEYRSAIKNGCTKKKWISFGDERVRTDHADVDGEVVDINKPFHVGGYLMMFPKDDSLGAGLEEIVNCRCSVEYLKETQSYDTGIITLYEMARGERDLFVDITAASLENIGEGSVEELQSFDYDGVTYTIDGKNVQQNNSKREISIAELLKEKLGMNVKIVPEIKGKYKNIPTPDYLINNERWDLKELKTGTSKELLRNIAHKKKKQAENFIFDITECSLSSEEVNRQAECLFNEYYNTKHVKSVIIVSGNQVERILKRKK